MYYFNKGGVRLGFIDDLINVTIESISRAATSAFSTAVKVNNIKNELDEIKIEIDVAYKQVGKMYVEFISESNEMPEIDVKDIVKLLENKIELEAELLKLENKLKDEVILQEKEKFENEFKRQKEALDEAKKLDVITDDEYNLKLQEYSKKLENFQAIRNVKKQHELGIISYEELQTKLHDLT